MDRYEAAMLLDLIKLSYPSVYRGMDNKWMEATINMWAMSFPEVPYQIMEQAFNRYRMVSKFPPTVAEMVDELRHIYYQAKECAGIHSMLGNADGLQHYAAIMSYTDRYKDQESLMLHQAGVMRLEGGQNGKANGSPNLRLNGGYQSRDELRQMEGTASPYGYGCASAGDR